MAAPSPLGTRLAFGRAYHRHRRAGAATDRRSLSTMCIGVGQTIAIALERV